MISKEDQLKRAKTTKRRKHSPKVKLDRKLVGHKGSSGIWSRIVKLKAMGKCEVCGSPDNLNAHHIEGRQNERLRYDLRNGVCLCAGCHTFRKQSAHKSPLWFVGWLKVHRSVDYNYIMTVMNEIKQWEVTELEELYNDYLNLEKQLYAESNARQSFN